MTEVLKTPIVDKEETNDLVFMLERQYEMTGMKLLRDAADELRRLYDLFDAKPIKIVEDTRPLVIRMGVVMKVCSKYFGVSAQELVSNRRDLKVMIPRHYTMYAAKELTNLSFPQVGAWFNRDHTTIVHAHQKVSKLIESQAKAKRVIEEISAVCRKEAMEERNRIVEIKKCQMENPMLIRIATRQKAQPSKPQPIKLSTPA